MTRRAVDLVQRSADTIPGIEKESPPRSFMLSIFQVHQEEVRWDHAQKADDQYNVKH